MSWGQIAHGDPPGTLKIMSKNIIEITGLDELRRDLDGIEKAAKNAVREFVGELAGAYKAQAFITGAIDTRAFVSGINGRQISAREFLVESDIFYDLIIEEGRRDTERYPKRRPLARAVEQLDRIDRLGDLFDTWFDRQIKGTK